MHQITAPDDSAAAGWERTLYAFLAEKEGVPGRSEPFRATLEGAGPQSPKLSVSSD